MTNKGWIERTILSLTYQNIITLSPFTPISTHLPPHPYFHPSLPPPTQPAMHASSGEYEIWGSDRSILRLPPSHPSQPSPLVYTTTTTTTTTTTATASARGTKNKQQVSRQSAASHRAMSHRAAFRPTGCAAGGCAAGGCAAGTGEGGIVRFYLSCSVPICHCVYVFALFTVSNRTFRESLPP